MRTVLWGFVGLFLLFSAARGNAAEDRVAVHIPDFVVPSSTMMDVGSKANRAVMRAFLAKYPRIQIERFYMPSIEGGGMDTGTLMGIASGNAPNAIYVNFRQSSSYINHGFLAPFEEVLARVYSANPQVRKMDAEGHWLADPSESEIAEWLERIRSRIAAPAWPVVYRKAGVDKAGVPQGKHVWAMPYQTLVKALLYRKDLFKEAGLDPDRPPETWQEMLEYSRRLKTLDNVYGVIFVSGPIFSWSAYSFMVSNGVRYVSQNAAGEWEASYNTPEAAETVYYLMRLAREPFEVDEEIYHGAAYLSPGGQDRNLKWRRGQIGMILNYLDQEMLSDINPEVVGVAPPPYAPNGQRSSELNARMLGVFSEAGAEEQLATARYIWYITGEEAQHIRTRVYVENGFGRFVNPELLEKFGYEDILSQVPASWRETFEAGLKGGVPEPYGKNTQFIYSEVSQPLNWAMLQPLFEFPREEAIRRIGEQLDKSVQHANKFLMGNLTKGEWRTRRLVGGTVLVVIFGLFVTCMTWVWRAFAREEATLGKRPALRRFIPAYLMLAPALLIVLTWQYGSVLLGAPLALFDYELVIESKFVGIDNFATVLYDTRFWVSLFRTFYYVLLVVGLGFWPPILVALLLSEVPTSTLKYFFRTIFYLPTIVSGIIMVFLWRELFGSSESGYLNQVILLLNKFGPIGATFVRFVLLFCWFGLIGLVIGIAWRLNELSLSVRGSVMAFGVVLLGATLWPLVAAWMGPSELVIAARQLDPEAVRGLSGLLGYVGGFFGRFNVEPLGWLDDPGMAMLCVVIPGVWATAGPGCIIYLAALKTVPEELVEAASVDGASILQRITYITLPRIKFLILIQLIGAVVSSFKGGTGFILAMTGGGPNGATRVLGMDIFERSFMELRYGVGAAMAWILGALVIMMTAYKLRRLARAEFRTAATSNMDQT